MIAFFILVVSLLFTNYSSKNNFKTFKEAESVLIVTSQKVEGVDLLVENGEEFYYLFEGEKTQKIFEKLDLFEGMKGVNLYFSGDLTLSYFQKKLDYITDKSQVEGSDVYYGYFKGYTGYKLIEGKKINTQLAKVEDGWVLGFPIILTGF